VFREQKNFWFTGIVVALAVLLGACSGTLPANMPDSIELELEDGVEELEFSGAIEDMGADGWTVAGVSFDVTNSTELNGNFELGDNVKVHAQLGSEDQLTAREIEFLKDELGDDKDLEDEDLDDDEDEFTGVIDSMSDGTWVIDGTPVAINGATEIKGDFSQGDLVKVHASQVDGTLTAREIEFAEEDDLNDDDEMDDHEDDDLEDDDDSDDLDDDSDEFVGIVEAIIGDSWTVNGMTFLVTSQTEIDDDIVVGDLVKVELNSDTGADLTAEEIELADDDDMDDDSDNDLDDDEDEADDGDEDSDDHDDDDDDDDDDHDDHDDDDDHDGSHDSDDGDDEHDERDDD
jgi:hypothetical protein